MQCTPPGLSSANEPYLLVSQYHDGYSLPLLMYRLGETFRGFINPWSLISCERNVVLFRHILVRISYVVISVSVPGPGS